MPTPVTGNLWTMVFEASPMVQFVLLTLVLFSVACWTVILVKARRFRQASRDNEAFEELFWESPTLVQAHEHAQEMEMAPMAGVFLEGYEELRRLRQGKLVGDADLRVRVHLETLERSLQKGIRHEMAALEQTVSFLATTGNAAPFIGLFGTVWGIMNSFRHIGLQGSASLATVAPGISEALVATAAGLAAAIPAVIAFNAFMSRLSSMEGELQAFANDFLNTVERQLMSGAQKAAPQNEGEA
jgi:biopolymer transport protein TolQ